MDNRKFVVAFVFGLASTLVTLVVLVKVLPGGSSLQISMAALGFIIFFSLFSAMVYSRLRNNQSS
jgi:hypothetical protein